MRCIFCKSNSEPSKSIEHIIPQSIGNKRHVTPRGIVCDRCNNYFSRKIEGPLLSHASFRNLRAWYQVPNKKGTYPSLYGFVAGTDIDVALRVTREGQLEIKAERGSKQKELNERVQREKAGIEPNIYVFPREIDPPKKLMSRFLAKMALEAFSLRLIHDPTAFDLLIDEPHFDRIRSWTRNGNNFEEWPYHQRCIFPEETLMKHPTSGEWVQAGFGYDLFMTKRRETHLAFCLYGYEFVINLGGPSIKGYEEWLNDHGNISPLVERIGLRLERRVQDGKKRLYLEGENSPIAGNSFDRTQIGELWYSSR